MISDLITFQVDEVLIVPLCGVGREREFEATCERVSKLARAAHAWRGIKIGMA